MIERSIPPVNIGRIIAKAKSPNPGNCTAIELMFPVDRNKPGANTLIAIKSEISIKTSFAMLEFLIMPKIAAELNEVEFIVG